MHCTYNGVGSLIRDISCGIALIEYDDRNNPKRIQFTNGCLAQGILINGSAYSSMHCRFVF